MTPSAESPLAELLREEIGRSGPMPFERFMELALYHPEHGYYRRARDPFGRQGDFYTAEQIQPVFGELMAALLDSLRRDLGSPSDFAVVELGAGRGEMHAALSRFAYIPVEIGRGAVPDRFTGAVFANEFFDALPVHLVARTGGSCTEVCVAAAGGGFRLVNGGLASAAVVDFVRRYATAETTLIEVNLQALEWLDRIGAALRDGFVVIVDYGYIARELARFPQGTLMSYRRHVAEADVLATPGERDVTAHVNFTALQEHAAQLGLATVRFETLAQCVMRIGEEDRFARLLAGSSAEERIRRSRQLKTLLTGMGETFRVLVLGKQKSLRSLGGLD